MRRRIFLVTVATLLLSLQLPRGGPLSAQATQSTQITVNTTSDVADFGGAQQVGDLPGPDNLVSLREAIIAANSSAGPQVIVFNIPAELCGGGDCTISPSTVLPSFQDDGITIDGTTQPFGKVVLHGGSVTDPAPDGLSVGSSHNVIRGLVINGFADDTEAIIGIGIRLGGADNLVEDNLIGTDSSGMSSVSNGVSGIIVSGNNHLIRNNVISGNREFGIELLTNGGGASGGHWIQGNKIGTDPSGAIAVPNGAGISIEESGNVIEGNVIGFNCCGDGISVIKSSVNNTITRNSIFSNGDLGIDLGVDFNGDGVTFNDAGDTDTGPNNFQNFPVLESARAAPGRLIVRGLIDTPNPRTVTIEFFATEPGGDPSGHGEGAVFLGTVRPNRRGRFTATLTSVTPGTLITATATDVFGNTSEFAANTEARGPGS